MTILAINQRVYIVDDDAAVRDSLVELMASVDIEVESYSSALEFLDSYDPSIHGCIILDIRMPGMSGLDLQKKLVECESALSIIFITGHGDVPMAVEAIKRGATEFIQKPFRDQELLDCIQVALKTSQEEYMRRDGIHTMKQRLDKLTPREKEVLAGIVKGDASKVVAIELGISQRTVENHRAKVMEKMQVKSTTALVKLVMINSVES